MFYGNLKVVMKLRLKEGLTDKIFAKSGEMENWKPLVNTVALDWMFHK